MHDIEQKFTLLFQIVWFISHLSHYKHCSIVWISFWREIWTHDGTYGMKNIDLWIWKQSLTNSNSLLFYFLQKLMQKNIYILFSENYSTQCYFFNRHVQKIVNNWSLMVYRPFNFHYLMDLHQSMLITNQKVLYIKKSVHFPF